MGQSIQDILAPLEPYWDRIIRRPMSSKDVAELERQVGLKVPAPLRDYLLAVGLFQDLTCWEASPFEVYESPAEFVSARKFLCEILPLKKQDLFPFGDDGAGNVFCLPTGADEPCRIHFIDHETGKISKKKDFDVWLQGVVAKVLRGIKRRVPNEHKVWAVQFTFGGMSYDELKKLLASAGKFQEIDREWGNLEVSPADVSSADRQYQPSLHGMTHSTPSAILPSRLTNGIGETRCPIAESAQAVADARRATGSARYRGR
jgi:hypothetical protein